MSYKINIASWEPANVSDFINVLALLSRIKNVQEINYNAEHHNIVYEVMLCSLNFKGNSQKQLEIFFA